MKLTFTVADLSIQDAADLETFLVSRSFAFDVRPGDPGAVVAPTIAEPPKNPRHPRLSEAQATEIYCTIMDDAAVGRRKNGCEYARQFSVGETVISRIALGNHPRIAAAAKARYAARDAVSCAQGLVNTSRTESNGGIHIMEMA